MKNIAIFGLIVGIVGLLFLFDSPDANITTAQQSDQEQQKRLERDKNIPQAKVDKAFAEAKKIQDSILKAVADKKPGFKLHRQSASHLISDVPGRRGETRNEISWRSSKTSLWASVILGFEKEEALNSFHKGLEWIQSGDFFNIPDVGDKAVLVKNVFDNTKNTSVGVHFVKGRAEVSIQITNHRRKTIENEKELMEIVRMIEPLIVARASFDD